MANNKDIELIIRAKLEAEEAVSGAQQLGTNIASAIERGLAGLGDKLADSIMKAISSKMPAALRDIQSAAGGDKYQLNNNGIWMPSGTATETKITPTGSVSVHSTDSKTLPNNAIADQTTPKSFSPPPLVKDAFNGFRRAASILNALPTGPNRESGVDKNLDSSQYGDFFGSKSILARVRSEQRVLATGGTVTNQVTAEELEKAKISAQSTVKLADDRISELSKTMMSLTQEIRNQTTEMSKLEHKQGESRITEAEKAQLDSYRSSISAKKGDLQQYSAEMANAEQAGKEALNESNAIGAAQDASANAAKAARVARLQKISTGIGMVGSVAGFAAQEVGGWRRYSMGVDAAEAAMSRGNMRDLAAGNYENLLATQQLGGEEKLNSDARSDAKWTAGGKMALGVAGLGGAIAMGMTGVGLIPALGVAGASIGSMWSGAKDFMGIDVKAQENRDAYKALQISKNKEYFDMFNNARGGAVGAYNQSIGMGSQGYADFLTQGDTTSEGRFLNLRRSGAAEGLTSSQVGQGLATYAKTAGVFNGMAQTNWGDNAMIQQLQKAQGKGLNNAFDLYSAFQNTGSFGARTGNFEADQQARFTERNTAVSRVLGTNQALLSSGYDQSASSDIMASMAASSQGLGGFEAANRNIMRAVATGQESGHMEVPELMLRGRAESALMSGSGRGTGIEGASRAKAISQFEKRAGVHLTENDRMKLLLSESVDQKGFEEIMSNKRYAGANKGAIAGGADALMESSRAEKLRLESNKFGGNLSVLAKELAGPNATTQDLNRVEEELRSGKKMPTAVPGVKTEGAAPVGKELQAASEKVDAEKFVQGMSTLKDVLPEINKEFPKFVETFAKLAASKGNPDGAPAPKNVSATPPGRGGR